MSQYLLRLRGSCCVDGKIKEKSANDYIKRFDDSDGGGMHRLLFAQLLGFYSSHGENEEKT